LKKAGDIDKSVVGRLREEGVDVFMPMDVQDSQLNWASRASELAAGLE